MSAQDLDYERLASLSAEEKAKLSATRPRTLGDVGRIQGVTPTAMMALYVHARQQLKRSAAAAAAAAQRKADEQEQQQGKQRMAMA